MVGLTELAYDYNGRYFGLKELFSPSITRIDTPIIPVGGPISIIKPNDLNQRLESDSWWEISRIIEREAPVDVNAFCKKETDFRVGRAEHELKDFCSISVQYFKIDPRYTGR